MSLDTTYCRKLSEKSNNCVSSIQTSNKEQCILDV